MTRLDVELEDFVQAARILDERVGDPVTTGLARLCAALESTAGMAGDDPAGRDWAAAYDRATASAVAATNRVAAAAYGTSAMFGRSALNYARAEAASTTGGGPGTVPTVLDRLPTDPVPLHPTPPPGAVGGGSGGPPGWGVVKDLVGYVWPNGHQDRLRQAAGAWRASAGVLADVAFEPVLACLPFAVDRLPEAEDMAAVCGGLNDRIEELAAKQLVLADACDELARRLDECHSEIESELSELGIESGIIQGVGAVASVFSFGTAEAPTQLAQAAKIARVAARVGQLIRDFVDAARVACEAVPSAAEVAERISQSLEALAGARLAYAAATNVPRVAHAAAMARHGREVVATERLARARTRISALRTPERLVGRKLGDPGVWGDERTLADHFARHGPEVGAETVEDYTAKASDLLHRAVRGELPVKIDHDGTLRVFEPKTGLFGSFRADGATKTLFKPPGPAYFDRQPGVLK